MQLQKRNKWENNKHSLQGVSQVPEAPSVLLGKKGP
jgi:hypothetical protein